MNAVGVTTLQVALPHYAGVICAAAAAWLMIRAGVIKDMLRLKVEARCSACGRRLGRGPCPCSRTG